MVENKSFTFDEIMQQPSLWLKVVDLIVSHQSGLERFLSEFYDTNGAEVIFTGAGSSFFIGEMVAPFFQNDTQLSARAIQTTEIVTHPTHHINKNKRILLVSFARSGNSPESVAAVQKANEVSPNVKHLIITCNKDGALATIKDDKTFAIVMPDEANDKSLAMTSSVTSMGLAALLVGRLNQLDSMKEQVNNVSKLFDGFFENYSSKLQKLGVVDYERAVCLGSGPMQGVAREGHLKLQELTDGEIICKFDSFLGFRHGPKAVVNNKTLMVYFFSNDEYVRQYELDLVKSMVSSHSPALSIGISNRPLEDVGLDLSVSLSDQIIDDGIWTITSLVPMQLLAFYKSVAMGYDPDSPSKSGAIHRVVQGVTIYNIKNKNGTK